jgi:hypothetical protein
MALKQVRTFLHFVMQLLSKGLVKWHISSAGNCMGFAMQFCPFGHDIQYNGIQHNNNYYESQHNTINCGTHRIDTDAYTECHK